MRHCQAQNDKGEERQGNDLLAADSCRPDLLSLAVFSCSYL